MNEFLQTKQETKWL